MDLDEFRHGHFKKIILWKEMDQAYRDQLPAAFDEGIQVIPAESVEPALDALVAEMRVRVARTLNQHNPGFVGRVTELDMLRMALTKKPSSDTIAVVHGLVGTGKTELTTHYAYQYRAEYSTRTFMLGCRRAKSLVAKWIELSVPLGIEFTDSETKTPEKAAKRIFDVLEKRVVDDQRSGGFHPACLIILDHVDCPSLLLRPSPEIPTAPWLHIVATTRLSPDELSSRLQINSGERVFIPIDELPLSDAVDLLARHQPGGSFRNDTEIAGAKELAALTGCLPMALEPIAIYLGLKHGVITCHGMSTRLRESGLGQMETIANDVRPFRRSEYAEVVFAAAVDPLLQTLSDAERFVLDYASLLPDSQIAVPWLACLTKARFPEIRTEGPDHLSPWPALILRLVGWRLLVPTNDVDANGLVRVARMPRLLQSLCQKVFSAATADRWNDILTLVTERADRISKPWLLAADDVWEIEPLAAFAEMPTSTESSLHGVIRVNVAVAELARGQFDRATALYRSVADSPPDTASPDFPVYLQSMIGTSLIVNDRPLEGVTAMERAVEAAIAFGGMQHPMIPYLRLQQGIVALRARDAEFAISRFRLGIDATRGPESQDAPIVACFHILLAVAEAFRNAGESVQVHVSAVRRIAEQLQDPGRGFLLAVADFIAGLFAATQRGDKTQAIQLINTACDSVYRRLPPQMPFREFLPYISAFVLKEQKKYSEAEEAMQAVIVKVKTNPFTNAVMPLMLKELADVQKARGHFLDAINTHRRSLEMYRENGQAESAAAATVHLAIGLLQMRLRQTGPMFESFSTASRMRTKIFGAVSQESAEVYLVCYAFLRMMSLFPPSRREAKRMIDRGFKEVIEPLSKAQYIGTSPPPAISAYKTLKRRLDVRIFLLCSTVLAIVLFLIGGAGYLLWHLLRWILHLAHRGHVAV